MDGLEDGEFMYFVHSYYAQPTDSNIVLSTTSYGQNDFCSSFRSGNVFGCQFHPERSGRRGIQIYQNLATQLSATIEEAQLA
jgi:glutamine amidotransferase